MPALNNPRHERFAQGLAEGKEQRQAYVDAGFKDGPGAHASASKLAKSVQVTQRVAELTEGVAQAKQSAAVEVFRLAEYDKAWVVQHAAELVKRCMQHVPVFDEKGKQVYVEVQGKDGTRQIAAAYTFDSKGANAALMTIARTMGHIQTKPASAGLLDALPPAVALAILQRLGLVDQLPPGLVHQRQEKTITDAGPELAGQPAGGAEASAGPKGA